MISEDNKSKKEIVETIPKNKEFLIGILQRGWDTFHKYFVYVLLATILGIGIGIKVSKFFYEEKMNDATLAGSFVFKGKAYTLIPK